MKADYGAPYNICLQWQLKQLFVDSYNSAERDLGRVAI